MNLYLSQLILEVTRKCNMSCDHCMRGDAQNIDMSTEIIDRLLDAVEGHGIGSVTFTGGEPTLNVIIIQYFVDQVKKRNISVGSFFIVTNGKVESIDLIHTLIDLYAHCDEKEMSGLVCSQDTYHEWVEEPRIYPALKFFRPEGHGPEKDEYIIQEGRAYDNGIGGRETVSEELDYEEYDAEYVSVNSNLHVASNGNIMSGCDFSFERVDRDKIGNILKQSLKTIIARRIRYLKRREAA
jgi:MoaA/NifB/PqqE/SkfB family radical SAM enzyme